MSTSSDANANAHAHVPALFPLVPKAMHYDWGNRGHASAVARLALTPNDIDPVKPYAELWMGTHPNAPSTAELPAASTTNGAGNDSHLVDLLTLIQRDPKTLLGSQARVGDLPFLFKVLSVAKPLSIQAHPDKQLARQLHADAPQHYKDANHKPEMAIALTEFHALFGFRPSSEIVHHLRAYPELAAVAGAEAVAAFTQHVESKEASSECKPVLRRLFTAIMTADSMLTTTQLSSLIARLSSTPSAARSSTDTLLLSANVHFPNDVGLFCILLMNHVTLAPGEAMYMGANELHAYLSGDCIEVMATSDNVVRAGLTPKFKDVHTLTTMLTYTQGGAHAGMLTPEVHPRCKQTLVYDPPIPEFSVHRTQTAHEVEVPEVHGPSVMLVTEGSGQLQASGGVKVDIQPGSVVYVVPGSKVTLRAAMDQSVVVYQALCEAALP